MKEQINRTEQTAQKWTHRNIIMISDKAAKAKAVEKHGLFDKWCGNKWTLICKRTFQYIFLCTENCSKKKEKRESYRLYEKALNKLLSLTRLHDPRSIYTNQLYFYTLATIISRNFKMPLRRE